MEKIVKRKTRSASCRVVVLLALLFSTPFNSLGVDILDIILVDIRSILVLLFVLHLLLLSLPFPLLLLRT